MNQYTELLYYIKSLADADELVNTVSKGDFEKLDLAKQNIFPLVHINITDAGFTNGSVVQFGIQIGAFDIRDINKEVETDKSSSGQPVFQRNFTSENVPEGVKIGLRFNISSIVIEENIETDGKMTIIKKEDVKYDKNSKENKIF